MKMKAILAWLLCIAMLLGTAACAEGEWRHILLLGNDTRNYNNNAIERSDVMLIVSVNEAKAKVKLTSVMRDCEASYAEGGGGKINGAMAKGGPDNIVKTLNKYFDLGIEDYVVINFHQMIHLVNAIGGVDIEITDGERKFINNYEGKFGKDAKTTPDIEKAGMVHLVGWQALNYCRDRKSSAGGDFDRVARQRKMMVALLKELQEKTLEEVMDLAPKFFKQLINTNMTQEEMIELGKLALTIDPETIEEFRIPADKTFESGMYKGIYKIKPNYEKNKKLLHEFINGADLAVGSSGEAVKRLQQKLVDMGLLNDKVDGVFGQKTAAAVCAAQKLLGYEETGIASEEFREVLFAS